MSRIIMFPYKIGSASCNDICSALGRKHNDKIFRVFSDGNYRPRPSDTIVNWGNSKVPAWWAGGLSMLNMPANVSIAVNKLKTFKVLKDQRVQTVPFTTSREEAAKWPTVVERHKLEAYGGEGIVINEGRKIGHAPLFTKFLEKSSEYRVHVFAGKVIDYSKKMKRVDGEAVARIDGDRVRNQGNGWVYIRDVEPRESVQALAIEAVEALGLDFGAVDIIRHAKVNYVLEVGTAAGLSPMGIEAYCEAILKFARKK